MLGRRGAVVVDSDRVAREVVEPGTPGLAALTAAFGEGILAAGGTLDRARLADAVFADAALRWRLEDVLHPLIRARTEELTGEALASGAPLVVADVPLLFETGGGERFPDGVMLVYADRETQLRRLAERERLDLAAAERRLAAQLPIDSKLSLATWVIDNRGGLAATEAQVERWWRETVSGGADPPGQRHQGPAPGRWLKPGRPSASPPRPGGAAGPGPPGRGEAGR
jgi:dephospho-CoA kinase